MEYHTRISRRMQFTVFELFSTIAKKEFSLQRCGSGVSPRYILFMALTSRRDAAPTPFHAHWYLPISHNRLRHWSEGL